MLDGIELERIDSVKLRTHEQLQLPILPAGAKIIMNKMTNFLPKIFLYFKLIHVVSELRSQRLVTFSKFS